ncbi:MAG: hypothetical protein KUG77_00850, partial [Nannocystaceae bacterium]|nr:hypothetical protein [Nannocystaceae bacterium]
MRWHVTVLLGLVVACGAGCRGQQPMEPVATQGDAGVAVPSGRDIPLVSPPSVDEQAQALAKRVIIVDGHIDVPWRL